MTLQRLIDGCIRKVKDSTNVINFNFVVLIELQARFELLLGANISVVVTDSETIIISL